MKRKIRGYVGISIITILTTFKRLAIGVILAMIGWLTYTVFFGNLIYGSKPEQVLSFFAIWFVAAYVFLPRIHRILTKLYIPDYFIGRVRTTDGLLSDPVNLAIIGSEKQLHKAMQNAGWVLADQLSVSSGIKMVISTLLRRSYPSAPVSSAFLFNDQQTFTYQQEVGNRPSARHHVRFWKTPNGWMLPGGHRVDWLASGTYDRSIGFSYFTFQITHKIDSDTDIERDYIVDSIQSSFQPKNVKIIDNYFSAYHHRSGGGDIITTDGALPIIEL
jgi:hypothetical protein